MVIEKNKKGVKRPRLHSDKAVISSTVLVRRVKPLVHIEKSYMYKKKNPKDCIWREIAGIFYHYGKISVL